MSCGCSDENVQGRKISDLDPKVRIDDNDLIPIVDVEANKTKRVTYADMMRFDNTDTTLESETIPTAMVEVYESFSEHVDNSGIHIPSGGANGQVLAKMSDIDYDVDWVLDKGGISDAIDAETYLRTSGDWVAFDPSDKANAIDLNSHRDDSSIHFHISSVPQYVPSGGTSGQVLSKASNGDYDVEWITFSGGTPPPPPDAEFVQVGNGYTLVDINRVGKVSIGINSVDFVSGNGGVGGDYSFGFGQYSIADGDNSFVGGFYSSAIGDYSTSLGYRNSSTGMGSFSHGSENNAIGNFSHAEGNSTSSMGSFSHTEGGYTYAESDFVHAEGYMTSSTAPFSHSEGHSTHAFGNTSHAEGNETIAGSVCHAEGNKTSAISSMTHSEGDTTLANGHACHAEGYMTTASNHASHAEGDATQAIGIMSHSEGMRSIAIGIISHAEGQFCSAIGNMSHAQGESTNASGYASHAGGSNTNAIGDRSVAFGTATHAKGDSSFSMGSYGHSVGSSDVSLGFMNMSSNQLLLVDRYEVVSGYDIILYIKGNFISNINYSTKPNIDFIYHQTDLDTRLPYTSILNTTLRQECVYDSVKNETQIFTLSPPPGTVIVGVIPHTIVFNTMEDTYPSAAITLGMENIAGASYAIAVGHRNKAYGKASFASGFGSVAFNDRAHSEGLQTSAWGYNSHAEGCETQAFANGTHAEGYQTMASTWRDGDEDPLSYSAVVSYIGTSIPMSSTEYDYVKYNNGGAFSHAEGCQTVAVGAHSHAEGTNAIAGGVASHAEGNSTFAGGMYSHVEGRNTKSTRAAYSSHVEGSVNIVHSSSSHAEGYSNTIGVDGDSDFAFASHAEGHSNSAMGVVSHVEGYYTKVLAHYGHTEGNQTTVTENAPSGHAEGYGTVSDGYACHAEGNDTCACGANSHAEGLWSCSVGYNSHAEGNQTTTFGDGSHAEGIHSTVYAQGGHSEGLKNLVGTWKGGDENPLTFMQVSTIMSDSDMLELGLTEILYDSIKNYGSGAFSHAEGTMNIVIGNHSHAEGAYNIVAGTESHAEGANNICKSNNSHIEGYNNLSETDAHASHVEGEYNVVLAPQSHAEGYSCGVGVGGFASHAEGNCTFASGPNSHAEGFTTISDGYASHAEGNFTSAYGPNSHAEGFSTVSLGYASHTEGNGTSAEGSNSHAEGLYTHAEGSHSHAEGSYALTIGASCHAENISCSAMSQGSHVEGCANKVGGSRLSPEEYKPWEKPYADGWYSHAEGLENINLGYASHVEGIHNMISDGVSGQHVGGTYNDPSPIGANVIIGNGSSNTDRSNSYVGYFDGTSELPESSVESIDARGDKSIITKEYGFSKFLVNDISAKLLVRTFDIVIANGNFNTDYGTVNMYSSAVQFIPNISGAISIAEIYNLTNIPNARTIISIYRDSDGVKLAQFPQISGSVVGFVSSTLSTPIELIAGHKYWLSASNSDSSTAKISMACFTRSSLFDGANQSPVRYHVNTTPPSNLSLFTADGSTKWVPYITIR